MSEKMRSKASFEEDHRRSIWTRRSTPMSSASSSATPPPYRRWKLFVAHDIIPIYPENHSVANLTAKKGVELCSGNGEHGLYDPSLRLCRSRSRLQEDRQERDRGHSRARSPHGLQLPVLHPHQVVPGPVEAGEGLPIFVFDTPEWIRTR